MRRTAVVVAIGLSLAVGAAAPVSAHPGEVAGAGQSLAGHHWRYRVQVDGKAGLDRVVFVGGKDLALDDLGFADGHITVHVHLAGSGRTVSSTQLISYASGRTPWTPLLGATNLDRHGGQELVTGFSTGAHAQLFTVLSYRNDHLVVLEAPGESGDDAWIVNSSFGTGSQGWVCTKHGVESRSVVPVGSSAKRFRIARDWYVDRSNKWVRTHSYRRTVKVDTAGMPPAATKSYPEFRCPGLPKEAL